MASGARPMSPIDATRDFWFAWDGTGAVVLGRSTTRPLGVTGRSPASHTFVVRAILAGDVLGAVTDFFWALPQHGSLRPMHLPSDAIGLEVSLLSGGQLRPLIRYLLDDALDGDQATCDVVSLHAAARQPAPDGPSSWLRTRQQPFAETRRAFAHRDHAKGQDLLWAIAAPFHQLDAHRSRTGIPERRVGRLIVLYPLSTDIIKVRAPPYRREAIRGDIDAEVRERESAIVLAAFEPRNIISLEINVPSSEVSSSGGVSGLVVFHCMRQRELITYWQEAAPTKLFQYTIDDYEALRKAKLPFPRSKQEYFVKAFTGASDKEAIEISLRAAPRGSGQDRLFRVVFSFATLGDFLIVYDMGGAQRLSEQDGERRRFIGYRVGAEKLEWLADMPEPGLDMIDAAHALDPGHGDYGSGGDEPTRKLIDLINALIGTEPVHPAELSERPLLPLVALSYDLHVRHDRAVLNRFDFDTFQRNPCVMSATILSPVLGQDGLASPLRHKQATSFSLRLAAQLGVFPLISAPDAPEIDVRVADSLTRNDARLREMWENASAVRLKIDFGRSSIGDLVGRLREFRSWIENESIVDELLHAPEAVRHRFETYMNGGQYPQQSISQIDFDQLHALIQPIAEHVANSGEIDDEPSGSVSMPPPDRRTTEELRADVAALVEQGLASDDVPLRKLAQQIKKSDYTLRKHLRAAEKKLKDLIGSPAISSEILALIGRLEAWANVSPTASKHGERRDRIIALARAFRSQTTLTPPPPTSDLGQAMGGIVRSVENEISRFAGNPVGEDGEVLSLLPDYTRLLCYHVANQAIVDAQTMRPGVPASAVRTLALWPKRAPDCWDKYKSWARVNGPDLVERLERPWRAML
ncbi:hypothetical protein VP06_01435 [Methylobacterium aquaticum]|uniref:Uncharacterized protein n=2 Tax=Methylobacterium aquaticum TaxID=270351 RepID=A0A0J6T6B2_9HYPH|nr:hypothetical protein VP06_01435 [Methylobacterium aquaticum]